MALTRRPMLTPDSLPLIQAEIAARGLDGWLLYEFQGANPIAKGLVGFGGHMTRRAFAWVPREGTPVAVQHAIEPGPWARWPKGWETRIYSGWRSLEETVAALVAGKRVAMEYSPGDAVPYLDRVPAGVLEMVRAAGATVVSSGELVTRFYATWTAPQRASHRRAAVILARVADEAIRDAARRARAGEHMTEYEVKQGILARFERAGLETDHGPIVGVDAHAADPHYEPGPEGSATIGEGMVLLVDLFAREKDAGDGTPGVYADQTWMATLGAPSPRVVQVWEAVRDARDAAIALLADRLSRGEAVRGGEADTAARAVIEARGYGRYFTHRTGHSIDPRSLHGAGPHLDDLESREERLLLPGCGFSIEPGIYLPGEFGVRSEVNGFVGADGLEITPEPQRELLVV